MPPRTKVLLVTGFRPFGGFKKNVSGEIAKLLDGKKLGDARVVGLVLPVSYDRAGRAVVSAVRHLKPDAVMMLGLHSASDRIRVEDTARNLMSAPGFPDCDGCIYRKRMITRRGRPVLTNKTLARELTTELSSAGRTAIVSHDAGGYVCNSTYYRVLKAVRPRRGAPAPLFVHLPPGAEHLTAAQKKSTPHRPFQETAAAVVVAARWLASRA